jgi:hypothetical protein
MTERGVIPALTGAAVRQPLGMVAGQAGEGSAAGLGITERSAHAIVAELTQAGYVVKRRDGRCNRYQIEAHLPLAEPGHGSTRGRSVRNVQPAAIEPWYWKQVASITRPG